MNLLRQILNEMLLLENVSIDEINSAIDNHERIIIDYHSVEDEDAGPRVVEVYAYGLTKKGNPVIRCFQPYGNTMSTVPAWKFFLINGIRNWKPTGQVFEEPAKLFNPEGDKTMSVVYNIAKFGQQSADKVNNINPNGPKISSDNIFKTDTEKRMNRLRNQLNNPINIKDLQKKPETSSTDNNVSGPKTVKSDQPEVYKTDTEKRMEKLRQQLNNPTYISNTKKDELKKLEKQLGDTSEPIKMSDLQQRLSQEPSKQDNNLFKTDTERKMNNLRQQLNNPQKIDLSRIPKR